jgi:hypothetical protein
VVPSGKNGYAHYGPKCEISISLAVSVRWISLLFWYSTTNNSLPSNNQFCFQGKAVNIIHLYKNICEMPLHNYFSLFTTVHTLSFHHLRSKERASDCCNATACCNEHVLHILQRELVFLGFELFVVCNSKYSLE